MKTEQLYYQFGKNLEWFMNHYQISRKELAKRLGVSISTVTHYILGTRKPPVETVINIMWLIGCNFDELFEIDEFID